MHCSALHLEPIVLWPSCYSPPKLEVIMTLAKISLASAAAITIISWGALAQENQNKGRITQLDHINGKITLQHAPAGTVGAAGASSLVDDYKNSKEIIKSELFATSEAASYWIARWGLSSGGARADPLAGDDDRGWFA